MRLALFRYLDRGRVCRSVQKRHRGEGLGCGGSGGHQHQRSAYENGGASLLKTEASESRCFDAA